MPALKQFNFYRVIEIVSLVSGIAGERSQDTPTLRFLAEFRKDTNLCGGCILAFLLRFKQNEASPDLNNAVRIHRNNFSSPKLSFKRPIVDSRSVLMQLVHRNALHTPFRF